MNKSTLKKVLIAVVICLLISTVFGGCGSQQEYLDDIYITLQDSSEKIIIKEWRFLLGSGAEVYYQKDDTDPVILGKTTGGDDGFCPFMEGMYEISQDGNSITVKWCFNPSNEEATGWQSKTFELPE